MGDYMSVSLEAEHHRGPQGMLYAESGMKIDACGNTGWRPGENVVLSLRDFPSLRIEVKDGKASVWIEENSVDTAGSIILCIAIVIALSHLTAERDRQNSSAFQSFTASGSGLFSALRLTAGLLLAAVVTIATRGDGVLMAQKELADGGNAAVAASVIAVVGVGIVSLYKSTEPWNMGIKAALYQKVPQTPTPLTDEYWAHLAFLTCEVLLLSTLAYSIPKSYGGDIVVASLFLIGLASTALVGDAGYRMWTELSMTAFKHAALLLTLIALATMIVTVMLFPMIVYSDGVTIPLAWGVCTHIFLCIAVLPALSHIFAAQQLPPGGLEINQK